MQQILQQQKTCALMRFLACSQFPVTTITPNEHRPIHANCYCMRCSSADCTDVGAVKMAILAKQNLQRIQYSQDTKIKEAANIRRGEAHEQNKAARNHQRRFYAT